MPPDASAPADRVRAIFERGRGRLLVRDLLHGVAAGALAVAAGIAVAPAMLIVVAAVWGSPRRWSRSAATSGRRAASRC